MTSPGGGSGTNDINLAALWIPVMPETSHMGEEMRKAGAESKRKFEEGFNSGSSPEAIGDSFSAKLNASMSKGLKGFELPFGLSGVFERMSGEVDKSTEKLQGQAKDALRNYTAEYEKLTQAQQKSAESDANISNMRMAAYQGLSQAQQQHLVGLYGEEQAYEHAGVKASALLPLLGQQEAAHTRLAEVTKTTGAAYEDYAAKSSKAEEATKAVAGHSSLMAGIMGGAVVAGVNAVTGAIEEFGEKFIEFGVETFKMGIEAAHEFADTMIEVGEAYEKVGIQTTEFSSATGEKFEELEHHAQQVFSGLDVAGENTGKTMAQFASMLDAEPGAALDNLTKHVEELKGRFSTLRGDSLAQSFVAFKVPVEEADSALASLLQSSRTSGQDLGQLTTALSGNVALTMKEAGLNIEQAGHFTAELMKLGDPGRQAMTGMATAMKEFTKEGVGSFSEGMKIAGERLRALGDTAEGQDLAQKLFGTRNWIVAKQAVETYMDTVERGPEAFNASGESIDEFTEKTRTLQNEWELVKHRAMEAFAPMGLEAVKLVGAGLDNLVKYVNDHMTQIKNAVKSGGVFLIQFAADTMKFAEGVLRFFAPIVNVIDTTMAVAIGSVSQFAHVTGEMLSNIPGFEDMGNGLIEASKEGEKFAISLGKLNVGDKMTKLADWIKQHPIDVAAAADSWGDFADKVGTSLDAAGDKTSWFSGQAAQIGAPTGGLGLGTGLGADAGMFPPVGGSGGGGGGGGAASTSGTMTSSNVSQKDAATAIFNAVKGAGYADETALAAVAAALHESSLNPDINNTEKGIHHGLFQESEDKPSNGMAQQINWFIGALAAAGGPKVVDRDPAMVIANDVERGGYSGSVYDMGAARKILGMEKGGGPGKLVTAGSGVGDDVAALLKRGEYVWDTDTMDKWGWLISAIHQGGIKGFEGGGGIDTQGAQVDTIAVARAAQTLFGIGDIGLYRSPDGYNEHASGEAADVMVAPIGTAATGASKELGDNVARYFLSNAGQFGVSYVLWQQHQWNPDGSSSGMQDRGGPTANHLDHVHVRTKGGGFPNNERPQGFAPPRSGVTDPNASPVAARIPGMAMRTFGPQGAGGGDVPPGSNGALYPGMPGQYGGYGVYGGMTADQVYSTNRAVQEAKDHASDLDYTIGQNQQHIDDLRKQLAAVGNDPTKVGALTGKPLPRTPAEIAADDEKRTRLNEQLDAATHQLTVSQRERSEQDGVITEAERKQQEAQFKKPKGEGTTKAGKVTGEAEFAKLGSSLLGGIGQELGFGDLFSKAPWEWGAVKLLTGAASWAMGTANAWADEIGKGHTGMTGFQPIDGWDSGSGAGGSGGLLDGLSSSLGINLPKSNISAGPNVVATQPGQIGVSGTGPLPGPAVNIDQSTHISSDVDPTKVLAPVQERDNSRNATAHGNTGGFPAS